jgi:twitching motility protein PilI
VLVANNREVPAGLMVDEVLGFRRFTDADFTGQVPPTILRCERYLAGTFKRGSETWPVFTLKSLLESNEFMQAAAS